MFVVRQKEFHNFSSLNQESRPVGGEGGRFNQVQM